MPTVLRGICPFAVVFFQAWVHFGVLLMKISAVYSTATFEEIKSGTGTSEIKVHIYNTTREEARLFIGIKGLSEREGDIFPQSAVQTRDPLRVRYGIGKIAVPILRFFALEITAPRIQFSGTTDSKKMPTLIVLDPGDEMEYYRFVVPTEWIQDQFLGGEIEFPGDGKSAKPVSVPIMRFSEAHATGSEQDADDQSTVAVDSKP